MVDGFPALLFGQRVTIAEPLPASTTGVSVLDLPLCSVETLDTIAVALEEDGPIATETDIRDRNHTIPIGVLRAGAHQDFVIAARNVVLGLPDGALRISSGALAAELRIPFRFAVVPKAGAATLVLRTVPYLGAGAAVQLPETRTWTVSYLFSPASIPVDRIAVTPEIAAETYGFTYAVAASRRNR
jgi:hypothetical protein